jgi:RHS repeat-associated protein
MPALARAPDDDCYSRAANDACINGGSWTRTKYSYDDAGNITARGGQLLGYNQANRLASATVGSSTVTNTYGASGQRVKKSAGGVATVFHYDRQGQLLGETGSGLLVQREYVWLEGVPLALLSDRVIPQRVVDNTDSAFGVVGSWSIGTGASMYGANFRVHGPAVALPGGFSLGVENAVPWPLPAGTSDGTLPPDTYYTGLWQFMAGTQSLDWDCSVINCIPYTLGLLSGSGAYLSRQPDSTATFTWTFDLYGRHRLLTSWPSTEAATGGSFSIQHRSGTASRYVQQSSSPLTALLGTYDFGPGRAVVTLHADDSEYFGPIRLRPGGAVAGRLSAIPVENTDSHLSRWAAEVEQGTYQVQVRWPTYSGAAPNAPFEVISSSGTASVVKNQSVGAGTWNLLGEFPFSGAAGQGVTLNALTDGTVLADAVRFVPVPMLAHRYHLSYFHVDHLGTPQKMTDSEQNVVWEAVYEPFGEATVTAEPHYANPLRFAGQYFDAETGLHQNWNRDYDPSIGRYLQSDPIGLNGGLSTYAYADGSPTRKVDPKGLYTWADVPSAYFHYCFGEGAWSTSFGSINWGDSAGRAIAIVKGMVDPSGTGPCRPLRKNVDFLLPTEAAGADAYVVGQHNLRITGLLEQDCNCRWKFKGSMRSDQGVDTYNFNEAQRAAGKEGMVSLARWGGKKCGAKPFQIHIFGSTPLSASGP